MRNTLALWIQNVTRFRLLALLLSTTWILTQSILLLPTQELIHGFLAVLFLSFGFLLLRYQQMIDYKTAGQKSFPKFWLTFHVNRAIPTSLAGLLINTSYALFTILFFIVANAQQSAFLFHKILLDNILRKPSLFTSVLAPLYEEFFFRVAVLSFLIAFLKIPSAKPNHNELWAVYLSSLIFWIFHLPLNFQVWHTAFMNGSFPLAPGPFLLGLVCGYIVVKDRSVWGAVLFHALANASAPFWATIFTHPEWFGFFYTF